jgi:hypothetical protein
LPLLFLELRVSRGVPVLLLVLVLLKALLKAVLVLVALQ